MQPGDPSTEHLETVRSELRRLGYLNRGFERFLLQDAMRPRQTRRTLLLLTSKVGLIAGLALALGFAFLLVAANGGLASAARDLPVLTLHLFPPLAAATGLAFLALCGLVVLVLRLYPVRHVETLALAAAVVAGAGGLALAFWRGRELVAGASGSPSWQLAVVAVAAPAVIYLVVKLAYHGLLALAIRLTEALPPRRLFSRRWLGFAVLAAAFVLTLPAILSARRSEPAPPAVLPTAPGERVLLVGIDGVLPEEVDYLLAVGDLPALARLSRQGGVLASYARRAEPPASLWTSVATGLPTPDHGVTALDSFLPWGAGTPLARSGPLRAYWSGVEAPLGLAEHRPVLANRRSAFAVWELAARGGAPVAAIDWWSTFPAEPLPGLVVAHGAYQLLAEKTPGAVAPAAGAPALARLAEEIAARPEEPRLAVALSAALSAKSAASLLIRALVPDRFYREVLSRELAPGAAGPPRAAALYLPGLDIAAAGWRGGDVAFADLLRGELQATDGLLGRELIGAETGSGIGTGSARSPSSSILAAGGPAARGGSSSGAAPGSATAARSSERAIRRRASLSRRSPRRSSGPSVSRRATSCRRPPPSGCRVVAGAPGHRRRLWTAAPPAPGRPRGRRVSREPAVAWLHLGHSIGGRGFPRAIEPWTNSTSRCR